MVNVCYILLDTQNMLLILGATDEWR